MMIDDIELDVLGVDLKLCFVSQLSVSVHSLAVQREAVVRSSSDHQPLGISLEY